MPFHIRSYCEAGQIQARIRNDRNPEAENPMKAHLLLALSLVYTPLHAATYFTEMNSLNMTVSHISIKPQYKTRHSPPTYLRFVVHPVAYSPNATLQIAFSHPTTKGSGKIGYRSQRDGIELLAENYVHNSGNSITLYLPDLKPDELVMFSVGWEHDFIPYNKAAAFLTTEQGDESILWVSKDTVRIFPDANP